MILGRNGREDLRDLGLSFDIRNQEIVHLIKIIFGISLRGPVLFHSLKKMNRLFYPTNFLSKDEIKIVYQNINRMLYF